MAFNFPPPFVAKQSEGKEQYSTPQLPDFSQPPPRGSDQHIINYNIPPPPVYQQPIFPRWEPPQDSHIPWGIAHSEIPGPSFPQYEQENHPRVASMSQPVTGYPIAGSANLINLDQSDGDVALPADAIQCRNQDEMWLKNWLSRCRSSPAVHSKRKEATNTLKVFQAREMLKRCLNLLQNLENSRQELVACRDTLSTQAWKEKWNHVKEMQEQIADALTTISDAENIGTLKKTLAKRTKKRLAQKRRRKLYQEEKKKLLVRRQQLHDNINAWLKNMAEVVEKAKREESLKHEADLVLGGVTRKKTEARRQISLLSALLKLRQIRAQTFASRGQPVSAESSARFIKVIEHLQQLWEDQLRGYNVEEQGLRVMLEEAVEERTQSYDKQAVAEWDRLLFGNRSSVKFRNFYLAAECNVEAFVAIRKSWDNYLAPVETVMSSAIPVGWVLPTNPSSASWEKHLKPHY